MNTPLSAPLLQMALRAEPDIFVLRQRGREVATAVGLEYQDQIRIATALSEVARDLVRAVGGADVAFRVAGVEEEARSCGSTSPRYGRSAPPGTSRPPARWPGWSTAWT